MWNFNILSNIYTDFMTFVLSLTAAALCFLVRPRNGTAFLFGCSFVLLAADHLLGLVIITLFGFGIRMGEDLTPMTRILSFLLYAGGISIAVYAIWSVSEPSKPGGNADDEAAPGDGPKPHRM